MTLCESCAHGQVARDDRGQQWVRCHLRYRVDIVPINVQRCTSFHVRHTPTREDFEEIAWTIDPKATSRAGFAKPPEKI